MFVLWRRRNGALTGIRMRECQENKSAAAHARHWYPDAGAHAPVCVWRGGGGSAKRVARQECLVLALAVVSLDMRCSYQAFCAAYAPARALFPTYTMGKLRYPGDVCVRVAQVKRLREHAHRPLLVERRGPRGSHRLVAAQDSLIEAPRAARELHAHPAVGAVA